jgi:hypothetical protein
MFRLKRLLVTILVVGLALVTLEGACHAITKSWDYTKYMVQVYMNGREFGVADVDDQGERKLIDWLLLTGLGNPNYEVIAEGTLYGDEWPPSQVKPVGRTVSSPWEGKLKAGDVIIVDHGHEGVAQPDGTIAHYIQIPPAGQTIKRSLLTQRCPDPRAPRQYPYMLKCGDWEKDPNYPDDPTKDRPVCCGEFKGDTWQQFLSRMDNYKNPPQPCWIYREKDTDKDRVPDWKDRCPNTLPAESILVDAYGCSPSQRDDDGDGVPNDKDACPNTPPNERKVVDPKGCGPSQRDTDGDGVMDDKDDCKDTPRGESADEHGCSLRQRARLIIIPNKDPVQAGEVATFTAKLEGILEGELTGIAGSKTYAWSVNGRPSDRTTSVFEVTIPRNYNYGTLIATVRFVIDTQQGGHLELGPVSKTVRVNKAPRTVKLGLLGPVQDTVGTPVTLQASVDGSPQPPPGTSYVHYWYVNKTFRTHGVNMDRYAFNVPRAGLRLVKVGVHVKETQDGGRSWQDVGSAVYPFSATGGGASGIGPFVGTWKAPYHGGASTLTISADGSGTSSALGTERTTTRVSPETPNKEVGTISRCVAEGQTLKCSWESTYSDGDKTITRGGTLTCTVNGDTLTATSTVDNRPGAIKEKWNFPPPYYPAGAKNGGTSTYTRAK